MRARLAALVALALSLVACPPPPDLDALPAGAILLGFGRAHVDSLECRRNDCTDWFRVRVPAKGDLTIEIRPAETAPEVTALSATLIEPLGRQLARVNPTQTATGRPELRIEAPVGPGTHVFAIATNETRERIDYRVSVNFTAAPAAPRPPRGPTFRTLSTAVLEVEGKRSVLLEAGASKGLRSGQGGRLVNEGRVIGEIVVTEVFNDGSRARIEGTLSGSITPRTRAEIQIPR